MKKLTMFILIPLLLASVGTYAQEKVQKKMVENYESMDNVIHRRNFTTKPALVMGTVKNVIFGSEPTIEMKRAMEDNIPIRYKDSNYYFNEGDFFSYNGGRYLLIEPPIGIKIKYLPKESFRLKYNDEWLFYFKGIFYKSIDDEFEVVKHPQGAIVYDLPPLTDVVTIDDEAYFEYLGVLYRKVLVDDEEGFEVVGELTE